MKKIIVILLLFLMSIPCFSKEKFITKDFLMNMKMDEMVKIDDDRFTGIDGFLNRQKAYISRIPGGWMMMTRINGDYFKYTFIPYSEVANDPLY